ncbi:hypothetical protein BJ912DRAFT_1054662 [Pholiota molesta]|nr:hypothetical protein BJ912DRAFT_1054662 [Pholiota molesta]
MDVDEEPNVPSYSRKGKGKERERDRYPAQMRRRSASLSPMREDTGTTAVGAPRRAHPDAYQHQPRWSDPGRLPPPAAGIRPALEPVIRSPPAPAPTRTTSQAQAQRTTSPPSTTSAHFDYDYAIEHSPPAAAYAMLQEERDERREYSRHGPPPPAPAYKPSSPPPLERRNVAQPMRMNRSRSRSMERGGYPPYGPPSARNPYYALSASAPMGVQSTAPPPSLREQTHENRRQYEGQLAPTQARPMPSRNVNSRRGFPPRGGSPDRQFQMNHQHQHQSQHQFSQHQPLPAAGRYSSFTPQQAWDTQPTEEQIRQQRQYHLESQQSNTPPNQQLRPRPSSSPARARAPSSAQTPSHPHPQWQAPQPPTPPPPPQAKPRTPRVRKPPPPKTPGMSEFDRPHPNPTVAMRTIPQPPPQLVAQKLAAQLGIPMGSTDLRGSAAPTTVVAATGSASGAGNGSQGGSAAGTAATAGNSMGSGLGGDMVLPPDLQVGAHLTQAADAPRLAQKLQMAKHRKSQLAQSIGDGASSSHPYNPIPRHRQPRPPL